MLRINDCKGQEKPNQEGLFKMIKCLGNSFWFDHFLNAGAEIKDFFVAYLEALKTRKKIFWEFLTIVGITLTYKNYEKGIKCDLPDETLEGASTTSKREAMIFQASKVDFIVVFFLVCTTILIYL